MSFAKSIKNLIESKKEKRKKKKKGPYIQLNKH
jgi:hypothetical protein